MPKHRRKDGSSGKGAHAKSKAKKQPATIPHALRKHKDKGAPRMEVRKSRPAPYGAPPPTSAGDASRRRRTETQLGVSQPRRARNAARRNMQKTVRELEERAAAADGAGRRSSSSSSFVLSPASFSVAAQAPVPHAPNDAAASATSLEAALEQDARETHAWARQMADASAAANTRRNREAARRVGAQAQSNAFAALAGADSDSSDSEAATDVNADANAAPGFQLRAATFTTFAQAAIHSATVGSEIRTVDDVIDDTDI